MPEPDSHVESDSQRDGSVADEVKAAASDGRRSLGRPGSWSDERLFVRYQQEGDAEARGELVRRYLPFARKLALRYSYTDEPIDDLTQVASVGLLAAIERFDCTHGAQFTSFATPTILGELKRHFRDKGWTVHVPRDLQERALALSRASERLANSIGRSPSLVELAAAVGCTIEQALEATEAAHSYAPSSLDAPVAHEEEDSATLVDMLGGEDDGFALAESRDVTGRVWRSLTEVERQVVALRFGEGLTQREIGLRIGYSQMHVSRLLRRALKQLLDAPNQT